jgi:hypothetical protein
MALVGRDLGGFPFGKRSSTHLRVGTVLLAIRLTDLSQDHGRV